MEGPRAVTQDELPLLEELVGEACGRPKDGTTAPAPRAFAPEEIAHIRAVFANGRPLGFVYYTLGRIQIDGCLILAASLPVVLTCPDWRNQGLATLVLDDCLGRMRREGVRLVFVADRRGLYRRLGFHPAGIIWHAALSLGELPPAGQAALRVAPDEEILPALRRLYEGENPRFVGEPCGPTPQVLAGRETHTCLAMHEGLPVAYAILCLAATDSGIGRILEYAGNRKALSGVLREIVRRFNLAGLEIALPGNDQAFLARLRAAGGDLEARTMPGSIGLLDPAGLWQDVLPRLAGRTGEATARRLAATTGEDGAFGITLGQEALVLQDQERLLTLFFGRGTAPWPDHSLPPNLFRVLSAGFPLPLPLLPGSPGDQDEPRQNRPPDPRGEGVG